LTSPSSDYSMPRRVYAKTPPPIIIGVPCSLKCFLKSSVRFGTSSPDVTFRIQQSIPMSLFRIVKTSYEPIQSPGFIPQDVKWFVISLIVGTEQG